MVFWRLCRLSAWLQNCVHSLSSYKYDFIGVGRKIFESFWKIFFGRTGGYERTKKAASNAKRYPLCENCQFPLLRKQTVSCLLRLRPNPRRTQKLCSGTQDKSCSHAIFQIAQQKNCRPIWVDRAATKLSNYNTFKELTIRNTLVNNRIMQITVRKTRTVLLFLAVRSIKCA